MHIFFISNEVLPSIGGWEDCLLNKILNIKATGSAEQKLAWQFRLYDRDGSGLIDLREMIEILVMILQNDYTRCHTVILSKI